MTRDEAEAKAREIVTKLFEDRGWDNPKKRDIEDAMAAAIIATAKAEREACAAIALADQEQYRAQGSMAAAAAAGSIRNEIVARGAGGG